VELLQLLIMALIAKSSRGDNLRMALKIMANRSIIKASWRAQNKIMPNTCKRIFLFFSFNMVIVA
jgi:hypothetical protein